MSIVVGNEIPIGLLVSSEFLFFVPFNAVVTLTSVSGRHQTRRVSRF